MTSCFFYGTLMHPKILERVTGSGDHKGVPAVLADHARFHLRNLDYPGLVFRPGHTVEGILVHSIDNDQMRRLDLFEGDEYIRREVTVHVNGHDILCQTYIFLDENSLEDRLWEYQTFEEDKSRRWLQSDNISEFEMLDVPDGSRGRAAMTFQNE